MNLTVPRERSAIAVDVDELLQDTYLLVVELRHGASVGSSAELTQRCAEQVDRVRQQLTAAGLSQRNIDHISHAQCALLDETILSCAKGEDHATWASEPLQAKFFNRHQAGEFLYEDMREIMREPAPDRHVLTAFQRVLMLGFRGRYREQGDPEREQLLVALSTQIPPLDISSGVVTRAGRGDWMTGFAWPRSTPAHVLVVALVLMTTWWGLDYLLSEALASLLPGQG